MVADGYKKLSKDGAAKSQCLVHNLVEKTSLGGQQQPSSKLEQIDEVPSGGSGGSGSL